MEDLTHQNLASVTSVSLTVLNEPAMPSEKFWPLMAHIMEEK